ncbi:MAG: carbohydrate-binding family 9-like protein [Chitinophagaceae bacterium]|nr:carbohydrate-binding family 9-like protein [Chitinophagaceae bacterium]
MPKRIFAALFVLAVLFSSSAIAKYSSQPTNQDTPLVVKKCSDFTINGKGDNAEWKKTEWVALKKIDAGGKEHKSLFKILYSPAGIYVLFNVEDEKITSDYKNDFENLFTADVVEVFFHTDPSFPLYFEYEISPLEKELVLLIPNFKGNIGGWIPWHYEGKRKVQKKIIIDGGEMKSNAPIKGWTAELFFPYQLLSPLQNVPPVSGARWNANFCRLDYDTGKAVKWAWSPVITSFHEYETYFSLVFE